MINIEELKKEHNIDALFQKLEDNFAEDEQLTKYFQMNRESLKFVFAAGVGVTLTKLSKLSNTPELTNKEYQIVINYLTESINNVLNVTIKAVEKEKNAV